LSDDRTVNLTYWAEMAEIFLQALIKLALLMRDTGLPRVVMTIKRNCIDPARGIVNAFDIKGPSGWPGDSAIANISPSMRRTGKGFNQPEAFVWEALSKTYRFPEPGKFCHYLDSSAL
jgi:hypothetical protein